MFSIGYHIGKCFKKIGSKKIVSHLNVRFLLITEYSIKNLLSQYMMISRQQDIQRVLASRNTERTTAQHYRWHSL